MRLSCVLAVLGLLVGLAACVARQPTTPGGYVIGPSVSADGGGLGVDAAPVDAGRSDG